MSVPIQLAYLLAAFLFALGLKLMSSAETARWGNLASACAMLLTVVVTLLHAEVVEYRWILVGVLIGSAIGSLAATRLQLTAMPELVALFNGFGGGASLLVGWEAYHRQPLQEPMGAVTILLAVVIGGVTFSGSLGGLGQAEGNRLAILQPRQAAAFPRPAAHQRPAAGVTLPGRRALQSRFSGEPDSLPGP